MFGAGATNDFEGGKVQSPVCSRIGSNVAACVIAGCSESACQRGAAPSSTYSTLMWRGDSAVYAGRRFAATMQAIVATISEIVIGILRLCMFASRGVKG